MLKKLMLMALSVGALLAFAAPAAQAGITLEDEGGNPVEVGELVTAVSTDSLTTATAGPLLNCETVGITGEVTENTPHVTIEEIEVTTSTPCDFFAGGPPLEAHVEAEIESITLWTEGEGTASNVAFHTTITTPPPHVTCVFEGVEYDAETEETIPGGMELGWNATSIFLQPTGHDNLISGAPCGPSTITGSFQIGNHDHTEDWELVED